MKRTFCLLGLLLVSTASYGEAEVWACQSLHRVGLSWENDRWSPANYHGRNFLLRVDWDNSSVSVGGSPISLTCAPLDPGPTIFHCINIIAGLSVRLNRESGQGGISFIHGSTSTESLRDSLSVSALQCTKF